MQKSIVFLACILSILSSNAQTKKLSIYKTFGGVVYEMDTLTVSSKQVSMILQQNPTAYKEFKLAKINSSISSVLGFSGGVLAAIPLATAVAGGQPEWIFAVGGGILILGSIPFHSFFKNRAANAIDIYNGGLPTSRFKIKPSLQFSGTRASLILRF